MSEHDCNVCALTRHCTRHPHVPKNSVLRAICAGGDGIDARKREQYLALWDAMASEAPQGEPRKLKARGGAKSCCGTPRVDKRAVSFAKTMAVWARDGFKVASDTEQAERLAICGTCPLNDNGWCSACGCHIAEKVQLRVSYCPAGKWFVERPRSPVEGPRNLMMHILPVSGPGVWQWNVEHLLRRIDLFDGKRVVAVLTPERGCKYELDSVGAVKAAFSSTRIDEWIVRENKPKLREVVTWPLLLAALSEEPGVTFACHAKGVTHGLRGGSITHRWTELQWRTCLDDWPSVERAMSQYAMAGAFKRYGEFALPGNNRWHYSGTFYWFRNDDVFRSDRNWRKIDHQFFGNESWPGRMFKPEETACLFCDDAGDLYKQDFWDRRVNVEFEQWQAARS